MLCLLIQPIHAAGVAVLENAGFTVRVASSATMEVVAREIAEADAAITRNAGLDQAAMDAAPNLLVLGSHGTGYDRVNVEHASRIGLPIVNTPYANVQSVAEQAIAQMLAIAKRTRESDHAVREGLFDYRYKPVFRELAGATLGIVGFGRIGRRTAEIAAAAFGMRVLVHSPSMPAGDIAAANFSAVAELDELLAEADIVSLHQRLTPATRGQFDAARLGRMKRGAMLVNTARGGLVEAEALIAAVESGHLAGAAMDVFDPEPLPVGHPYTRCDGIVLSPHVGGATREAMARTAIETARQVVDVIEGRRPDWLVNAEIWDRRRMPTYA
jgi:D-3-phosphoglycerate dehydrogenase / 2-oxoglutarate reductase